MKIEGLVQVFLASVSFFVNEGGLGKMVLNQFLMVIALT